MGPKSQNYLETVFTVQKSNRLFDQWAVVFLTAALLYLSLKMQIKQLKFSNLL